MGDVTASRREAAINVQAWLAEATASINTQFAAGIESPLTVTLGDEFQGITASLEDAVLILFRLERVRLETDPGFALHYSLVRGQIDTPVNPEIAHGMLGPALTEARRLLILIGRRRNWVQVSTGNGLYDRLLSNLFDTIDSISQRWRRRDYALVEAMLSQESNSEIGERFGKTRSQVWKRRQTLLVDEYARLADTAIGLAKLADGAERGNGA